MDRAEKLIVELERLGMALWAEDGRLRYKAPHGGLTPELKQRLADHKEQLLALLSGSDATRGEPDLSPIEARRSGQPSQLSYAQQRLWFLAQMLPGSPAYNMPFTYRLEGALNLEALERALCEIVRRHDSLRTTFVNVDGQPLQVVGDATTWTLLLVDLSTAAEPAAELERRVSEEASRAFDLTLGPLFRARVYRVATDRHLLQLTLHHIISDGWSTQLLLRELRSAYEAFSAGRPSPLARLPIQYADFAEWQRGRLQGHALDKQLGYWKQQLNGAPALLELPAKRPRPASQSYRGATETAVFPQSLLDKLEVLSREERASLFMTLLAAFQVLLCRYSGQSDISVGTPTAGRNRPEVEGLIGFFVNMLVLRTSLSGNPTFRELLHRVKEVAFAAYAYEGLPFEKLVEELRPERNLSYNPLFQISFALEEASAEHAALGALQSKFELISNGTSKFDLTMEMTAGPNGLHAALEYSTDLFDREMILRMLDHFRVLLEGIAADPDRPIMALPLLASSERRQLLVEWNDTAAVYPAARCVDKLVEEQARMRPDALALQAGERRLTYRELDERAGALAEELRLQGVRPGALVAVYLERSLEMVVGLLAVWKAGGAYVPVDAEYPAERVRFVLEDTKAVAVLSQNSLCEALPASDAALLLVDVQGEHLARSRRRRTEPTAMSPQQLAYVIYTSGSTGTPKGVPITHESLCNLIHWHRQVYEVRPEDRATQIAGPAFDASVWELWPYLTAGASVHLPDDATRLDPRGLVRWLLEQRITLAFLPTPLAEVALRERWPQEAALRVLLTGGDRLSQRPAQKLPFRLVNHYGPTENTVVSTCAEVPADAPSNASPPIGRPLPNTQAYVLDAQLQPVPIGVPGELHVGGVQLAPGYWNRPELRAEKFIANPFRAEPGARLYKTGDLVRYLPDGNIEFLGRIDDQVKIRGFRIELGEIETVIARHPAVREAMVLAREDVPGDKRLVGYVVAENAPADLGAKLRAHLRASLPEYMVPAHFVVLDALPLTENGKVDRKRLPAPEHSIDEAAYVAPRTPTEEIVASVWAEVLGVEHVGVHENFFELGGHSLLAVSVIERMRQAGLHADVRTLFTTPTVAALAAQVGDGSGAVEVPPNAIPPGCEAITPEMLPLVRLTPEEIERVVAAVPGDARNVQDIYPLAPLQEGILFHHLMAGKGDPYLLQALVSFDSRARLDAYVQALRSVVKRHDILRTAVLWEGLAEPVQVVLRKAPLIVEEVNLEPADGDIVQQLAARFDPRHYRLDVRQAPLLRLFIAHDTLNARWVMLQLFHHLAIDHTTLEVVQQEIQAYLLGQAEGLPAPLPFRNFVAQARLGVPREEHEAFFKKLLGDVAEPTAPFGLVDVQGDGLGIAEARLAVDASLARRLREQARALGVSAASVCHLAWAQVLARVSGREDVVFGTVLFGRMQSGDGADRVLGLLINTLPVRIRVGDESVQESVRHTHRLLAQLLRHEHASLALAQRCSAVLPPAPLFSALLNYRHSAAGQLPMGWTEAWPGTQFLKAEERTNYPLSLDVDDLGEGFTLTVQVQPPIDPERICGYMQTALGRLIEALETAPTRTPLRALEVLPASERRQLLVEWNDTDAEHPVEAPLHELFEAQAARTPQAPAVVSGGRTMSYRELDVRANQLAHYLRKRGVGPDVLVALCVKRDAGMVVALLGILKAGGAYVPLDPDYPRERLAFMLGDCGARALITQQDLQVSLPPLPAGCEVIHLDRDAGALAAERSDAPLAQAGLSNLAYAIYTSGSTGQPKAALIAHRGLLNLAMSEIRRYGIGAHSRVLQFASLSFDTSISEIAMALCSGATLHVEARGTILPGPDLERYLERERITVLSATPSALAVIDPNAGSSVQQVIVGGETCPAELAARWMDRCRFFNSYGPTEATVTTTYVEYRDGVLPPVIGRPLPNVRVYLLDGMLQPVPEGVAGELYIGGVGVARGYLNRPQLTAERFIPDPFCGTPGALMYRSGDFARWCAGGQIEFIGRNDNQVKLRGFRIELGEIENALARHPQVQACVVIVREDTPGDRRLVAYLAPGKGEAPTAGALREHLKCTLPDHMVPAAFVTLDKLPLTPNDKVDRKALPVPERASHAARAYEAPVGEIEISLAQIWAGVLKLERVGRHDNFFELGGHSLLAISVIERMRRAGLHTDVRALFVSPTLTALAAVVGGESELVEVPPNGIPPACAAITPEMVPLVHLTSDHIERIVGAVPGGARNVQDIYPLAPLQEGILFHHLLAAQGDPYLLSFLLGFDSRARLEAYLEALQAVIDRHDILRTALAWEGLPEPVQVVWRQAKLTVEEISLDPARGDVGRQLAARFDPRHHRLDVRQAPLTRVYIAEDTPNKRWLLLELNHHLSGDNIALEVVQEEIQAYLLGQAAHLSEPLPFRNFVAQTRLGVSQEDHEAFFRKMLADVDEPTAPFGLTNVHGDGSGISETRCVVDAPLAKRLRESARALGVSAASVYHLAWAQVLARVSGRDDIVFGTVLSGRMQAGGGFDRAPGLFINTLPVRLRIGEDSVQDSVRQTHALLAQLLRHEHAALGLAQRCSAVAAPAPLFSALLNYRHAPHAAGAATPDVAPGKDPFALAGIEFLGAEERTNYPFVLSVDDLGDGFALTAQVQSPLDPQRICTLMHTALDQLVSALESAPATSLRRLDVLPDAERRVLLEEWNDTKTDYPATASIPELFEAQVRRTPERIAIKGGATALTYAELEARATRITHALRARGVARGQRIGLCVERSADMPASVLGILKAGAAYVPLDPTFPRDRLRYMADDAELAMLVSTTALARSFDLPRERQLLLDADAAIIESAPASPLQLDSGGAHPEDPAYLIYTSGSTGKPKGVVVPHRAVVNFLSSMAREPGLAADDVLLAVTTLSFDIAVLEIQLPLTVGAKVILATPEEAMDGHALRALLEQHRATVMQATPVTWRLLLEAGWMSEGPFKALVGGEALPKDLADQLIARGVQLWNMYGPTETTVWSTCTQIADTSTAITIGRPIANTVVRILDRHQDLCPIGVPGELCIGGEGVALGYWNRPELTAERFVADPFNRSPRATLYRTGDLACYLPDGSIKCLGRLDHQVKIRGFRIELGEIEAGIGRHPAVREVVVIAREDLPGEPRLVAYLVAENASADLIDELRAMLRRGVPEYMVPAYFIELDALPLTANGKLDRKALPAPDTRNAPRRADAIAPRTPTEERVMAAFRGALERTDFGVFDNFFHLGGHSLVATRLMSRLWTASGANLPLRNLFERPTVAGLAEAIDALSWPMKPLTRSADNREQIEL